MTLVAQIKTLLPGLFLASVIAFASSYIASSQGGPTMLYALLIGMAFNFLSEAEKIGKGIAFTATHLLRVGVALLGARIAVSDIAALGLPTVGLVLSCVTLTLIIGTLIGRALGLKSDHAVLSAGAVAICGASATLAISSVLPRTKALERNTLITIVGVTSLSTLVMILYPLLADALDLSNRQAGIFIGATIHDVAQVVGAGYMISPKTGETATIVKLMRVACLAPVVLIIGQIYRSGIKKGEKGQAAGVAILPPFMIVFLVFVAVNSASVIPAPVAAILSDASRWALLIAVSALGVKTSLKEVLAPGMAPLLSLLLQTALLATLALSALIILF